MQLLARRGGWRLRRTRAPKKEGEVVQAQLDSFFTAVLATVHAGAWKLDWVAGLLFVLLAACRAAVYSTCSRSRAATRATARSSLSRRLWRSLARR